MTEARIEPAREADAEAVHQVARESWHAAYDDILGADTVDAVVAEWYEVEGLRDAIARARSASDVAFPVARADPSDSDGSGGVERFTGRDGETDGDREGDGEGNGQGNGQGDGEGDGEGNVETLLGFAHATGSQDDPDVAYLVRIYTHPAWWGQGVGTALLAAVEEPMAAHFDRLALSVLADNRPAVSFYESRGFERVETRPCPIDETVDEHVYRKRLEE